MTEAQKNKFKQLCYELDKAEAAKNLKSYDNMCDWLRKDHNSFYNQVKDNLYELWEEVKNIVSDILEGIGLGAAIVIAAPVVGVIEGIKAIGKWLDD
ncbi:hypothetical protein QUW02_12935 [Bacteroides eggerthii]|uniref:Uncharacterized protein n=1 Tax=Bacteroides eggerthii TaxID=28111 RepID=A0ABT7U8F9_9BACE|nr:hypothetical protein [Bacteroides eggerthii]